MKKFFIKKVSFLIVGIYLFLACSTQAQQQLNLTLDAAISTALEHSKQLKVDSINLLQADVKFSEVRNVQLPQVNVNLSYVRISDNITPFKVVFPSGEVELNPQILNQSYNSLQVKQLIWSGNRVKLGAELLALDKKTIVFDLKKDASDLTHTITTLWYNLFSVKQSEKLLEINIALLNNQKKDAENFVKQGIGIASDVLKIDLAISSLQSNLSDLNTTQSLLSYNLCTVMGLDTKTVIELPETMPEIGQHNDNFDQFIISALTNRAELKSLLVRKDQADICLQLTKNNILPTVSAGGSYNVDYPSQRQFPNKAEFTGTWNVGIFFNWNLTDIYTNKSKMTQSALSISKINTVYQQAQEGIKMEVNADFKNYLQAKEKIILANKTVDQATENFRVEQNKFQNQTTTATEFLNANTLLIQAKINLTAAIAQADLAYKKLLKSVN